MKLSPGPKTRFVPNRAGIEQLKRRPQTGAAMEKIGNQLLRQIDQSGRFTKGYKVESRTVDGTAGVRVGTSHSFAHWDEWGMRGRAPRAPLRRALSATGLLSKTKVKGK